MGLEMYCKGIKNFFPVPNMIFSLGLCSGEIVVYMYLMFMENRETYTCYPSFKKIGNAVKMSRGTVKKYVDSLVEKQLISVKNTTITTRKGLKRNGSLEYTILPIQIALDYYNENQIKLAQEQIKLAKLQKRIEKLKTD
jgi:DNA-binding MarR family transcriptional regulator